MNFGGHSPSLVARYLCTLGIVKVLVVNWILAFWFYGLSLSRAFLIWVNVLKWDQPGDTGKLETPRTTCWGQPCSLELPVVNATHQVLMVTANQSFQWSLSAHHRREEASSMVVKPAEPLAPRALCRRGGQALDLFIAFSLPLTSWGGGGNYINILCFLFLFLFIFTILQKLLSPRLQYSIT